MDHNLDYQEKLREWHLENYKIYIEGQRRQFHSFDKNILFLSAGSFGVSFAFINKFVNEWNWTKNYLIFSWACYSSSLIITLFSFLLSQIAYSQCIKEIDDVYKGLKAEPEESLTGTFVSICNWISFILFLSATITQIYFVAMNI